MSCLTLSEAEEYWKQLARHKSVRAKHDWGQGLEQALYVDWLLDEALRRAVAEERLTVE